MWPFSSTPNASPPRLRELEERLTDVELELKWTGKKLTDLNARLATVQREKRRAEDAVEPTNGDEPDPQDPPRRAPPSTAHLARRFRGF